MTTMTPSLSRFLERLDRTQDAETRDDLFLKLALWVERSFVAHRSEGDEQLQSSELPPELLALRLPDADGRELAAWLTGKLSSAIDRDGALSAMTMLPGSMVFPPLLAVLMNARAAATSWNDGQVSRMFDTLSFRAAKEYAPADLPAFREALRSWSIGRSSRVLDLASRLLEKCTSLQTAAGQ